MLPICSPQIHLENTLIHLTIFDKSNLPLGETMTGWVRRGSPGAAKLITITKTDPWLVPTHKEAETAVSKSLRNIR